MSANKTEMYQNGYSDYLEDNDCHFPDDNDYMEGWEDAREDVFELEMEANLVLQQELYENEHMYFEA